MSFSSEMESVPFVDIELRPVEPADTPFLIQLYASTRADELGLVPWSVEQKNAFILHQFQAQQQHYRKKYPGASHDIVLRGDRGVGQMYIARLPAKIHIVDISIVPAERNRGLGTYLTRRLMEESQRAAKPLTIYVESFNPSARLFQRLGFVTKDEQGVHVLMEWSAKPSERLVRDE